MHRAIRRIYVIMKHSAEEYLKGPYTYILVPDEMGGYAAEILEFPGCFAEGETANAAMKALDRAAAAWIRAGDDELPGHPRRSKCLHRHDRDPRLCQQLIRPATVCEVLADHLPR